MYVKISLDTDFLFAFLALPTTFNKIITPEELFYHNVPNVDSSGYNLLDIFKYEKSFSGVYSFQEKQAVVLKLSNCMKQLIPALLKMETAASRNEPVMHIMFRYMYFFYVNLGNVLFNFYFIF